MAGTNSVFSVNDNQKIQKSRNGPGVPIEIAFSATGSDCLMDLSSERFSRRTEMDGWMDGWEGDCQSNENWWMPKILSSVAISSCLSHHSGSWPRLRTHRSTWQEILGRHYFPLLIDISLIVKVANDVSKNWQLTISWSRRKTPWDVCCLPNRLLLQYTTKETTL